MPNVDIEKDVTYADAGPNGVEQPAETGHLIRPTNRPTALRC